MRPEVRFPHPDPVRARFMHPGPVGVLGLHDPRLGRGRILVRPADLKVGLYTNPARWQAYTLSRQFGSARAVRTVSF